MNEHEQPADPEDRLTDRALSELLGGETPPDLSERIFTAARNQPASILGTGEQAMNETKRMSRTGRMIWITTAIAASLLVVGGLLLPEVQPAREAARRNPANLSDVESNIGQQGIATHAIPSADQPSTVDPDVNRRFDLANRRKTHAKVARQRKAESEEMSEVSVSEAEGVVSAPRFEAPSPQRLPEARFAAGTPLSVSSTAKTKGETSFGSARESLVGGYGGEYGGYGGRGRSRDDRINVNARGQDAPIRFGFFGREFRNVPVGPQPDNQGQGPGNSGDQYTRIYENPFIEAKGENAVSTFSIDVDTASYANVRQFLLQSNRLPPPDAVRLEELVNYFDYDYSGPTGEVPFAAHVETAGCPWQPEHRLVRIGIKGHEIERTKRPQSNLVFLIDVSGSMNQAAKLPLLVEGMKMLTRELGENDRVAIVVYASSEGLALPSTPGDQQATVLAALEQLRAGGSTAGGAGIELAYQTAQDNFIEGGTNRVILCTDGDFNVGVTSTAELERMAEAKAEQSGIFLTVLGFGRGNLNDAMMEAISGKGNGNYHYVDNQTEARKVLVEEMVGTLVTIAKDVKIQVEFNPAQVAGYRLLGYENRMLRTEDFNDDKKDAGEIGAGHTVTALYEVVPAGKSVGGPGVDPLKYQQAAKPAIEVTASDDLLTLKIRYKKPDGDTSTKLEFPITDGGGSFAEATGDFQFAAAVASFGMLLRESEHRGYTSYAAVLEIAESGAQRDPHGYRAEFLQLVQRARRLAGE